MSENLLEHYQRFLVSLDIGQAQDYTALTVLERIGMREPFTYHLRFLKRFPLLMPYPDIFAGVVKIISSAEFDTPTQRLVALDRARLEEGKQASGAIAEATAYDEKRCTLLIDATGVGAPVVDIFRGMHLPVKLVPVLIVGGAATSHDGKRWHVPKRDLATAVKVLLDSGRLKISTRIDNYKLIVKELETFRVKISAKAVDTYEAWREKDHDDLVLSVALACWWADGRRKKAFDTSGRKEQVQIEETRRDEVYTDFVLHPPSDPDAINQGWTWNEVRRHGGKL